VGFSKNFRFLSSGIINILLLVLILFAGCKSPPHTPQLNQQTNNGEPELPLGEQWAESRPEVGDRTELTMAMSGGEFDPDFRKSYLSYEAQLYTALYEGLFSYNPITMLPVAGAASKWEVSDDNKVWTFKIRPTARYWNGDKVKAEDFRAAWISLLDPKKNSPYSSLFDVIEGARDYRLGKNPDENSIGVDAADDGTLVVRLNSPAPFFPSMLCHHSFSPAPPSMLEKEDWTDGVPVSNGPFYLVENNYDGLVFAKNEKYWDAANVHLSKITVKWTDDPQDASFLWNTGIARWVAGDFDISLLKDKTGLEVNPMFATHYYYINSGRKPWDVSQVRRALVLALPWADIRKGLYLPAKTLIYPIEGYPKIEGLDKTDTDEARKILKKAGFPGGKGLPELVIRSTPGEEAVKIANLMGEAWKKELGVKVKIEYVPFANYFDSLKSGDYDVGFTTWIGDFADPYTFLQMWRSDSNLNDAHFKSAEYEKLLDKSMGEEGEARFKTLSRAEELLLQSGAVLPISYSFAVNLVDLTELEGWFKNVLDIHPFKYIGYKELRPLPGVAMLP